MLFPQAPESPPYVPAFLDYIAHHQAIGGLTSTRAESLHYDTSNLPVRGHSKSCCCSYAIGPLAGSIYHGGEQFAVVVTSMEVLSEYSDHLQSSKFGPCWYAIPLPALGEICA
jgi:hypothetical protein